MIGKVTRANVEEYAEKKGLQPIQIDGIPDGFAWIEPNININGIEHKGRIIKFKPLANWQDEKVITYDENNKR